MPDLKPCGCGRVIPKRVGPGRPRTKCDVCSPGSRAKPRDRPDLTSVQDDPPAPGSAAPTRLPRSVEAAAQGFADELFSDHPAAEVLTEVVLVLARDIDGASEVRDRVAAVKELRALIADLAAPAGDSQGGGDDDDDFLGIGDLPPGVGDSATG